MAMLECAAFILLWGNVVAAFRSILAPVLLLLVAMTSVQSGASLAKTLFPDLGALGVSVLRLCFAAIMLVIVMRPWRGGWPEGSKGRALIMYGVALGGMNMLFYQALETIPLGVAVALEFTGPLTVALLGSRRVLDLVWIALAVFGLYLLLPVGDIGGDMDPLGIAYALGAGACWGFYIIWGRKAGARHGRHTVALGTVVAGLVALPIGVVNMGADLIVPHLWPLAAVVALLSTALPYSLEMIALRRMPARLFSMLMSLEPAVGALSGLVFLHEQLSLTQYLAIAAIIVAAGGAAKTAGTAARNRASKQRDHSASS
ncbi:Threonine/homoserine exporter RhtA [Carnimonas sp. R-84865]